MSLLHFDVHEHSIPTTHIREYPRALASDDQEDVLHLAIKQYTPKKSRVGDQQIVTIIAAHANGFPKVGLYTNGRYETSYSPSMQELYEPLWDDLYARLKAKDIHVHGIWIADVAHQGASGVLNEEKVGNDRRVVFYDVSRSLLTSLQLHGRITLAISSSWSITSVNT